MTTTKQGNGRYWTRFRIKGQLHQRRFATRDEGVEWEAQTKLRVLAGARGGPDARTTLRSYAEAWTALQRHRASTATSVQRQLDRHILPTFGDMAISQIRRSDVQGWVNDLERSGLAPSTIRHGTYRVLRTILQSALDDEIILSTPCRKIRLPDDDGHPVLIPTPEQVEAMGAALGQRWGAAVALGAGAGTRIGECLGLTVDRVDFDAKEIVVDRQMLTIGGRAVMGAVKTKASVRRLPVPDSVIDAIRAHLSAYGTTVARTAAGERVEGVIFSSRTGAPVTQQVWWGQWSRALKRAKVPAMRYHDLRHFYASMLLRGGMSETAVAARMGHASTAMLGVYGHEWHDDLARTRAIVGEVLPARGLRLVR